MGGRKYKIAGIVCSIMALLLSSCVTTRYVPDAQYLLKDVDVEIDNKEIDKEELTSYLRQKENMRFFGMKFHLFVYSISNKKREDGFFKRIGEAPVIFDESLHEKSIQQLEQYLRNKGYYDAEVSDSLFFKPRKVAVKFDIKTNEPSLIDKINYTVKDLAVSDLIASKMNQSLIVSGNVFDVDVLDKERDRITDMLKNEGYYQFYKDYIHYTVDTTYKDHLVDVEMVVEKAQNLTSPQEPLAHKRYMVDRYNVYMSDGERSASSTQSYSDSLVKGDYTFFYSGKLLPLRQSLIPKVLNLKPRTLYSKVGEEKSYNSLYELQQFKYVNMQFSEEHLASDSVNGHLVGHLYLPMQVRQNYSLKVEGTNNSSGNVGIGGSVNYQNRNLFRGAEIFDMSLRGSREWMAPSSAVYNMLELGGEAKISLPAYSIPFLKNLFGFYAIPKIQLGASYNYQERKAYTRTIASVSHAYLWKSDARRSHTLNLIDLNIVRIFSLDSTFFYNPIIKSSYTDHVVPATNYTYVYSRKSNDSNRDYHYLRYNVEAAGNLLYGLSNLFDRPQYGSDTDPYYRFLGSRFSQYVKNDFEYWYGTKLNKIASVAARGYFGIGLPYGNYKLLPPENQYYTGGANGVRAWQVRSVGPGSYKLEETEYPNQSSDIKIEANIEYRFRFLKVFEGAVFLDAGNVWSINTNDNREGALFRFDSFAREFAIGTGVGLRFITNYFIARVDLGLKLHDPSLDLGERWIPANRSFTNDDLNFNLAIGYPF